MTSCKRFVETGCGLYLDPKWLSRIDHGVLVSILRFLLFLICRCYRSRRRARFMFSSPSFPSNTLGCEGRSSRCMTPLPESRATARRREENVFGVLNVMGGLAGGRVRSRNRRGIPKKKSCSLNSVSPALRVIQRQGKFDSKGLVKTVGS